MTKLEQKMGYFLKKLVVLFHDFSNCKQLRHAKPLNPESGSAYILSDAYPGLSHDKDFDK